jgi:Flp pilus assembly protein TadG
MRVSPRLPARLRREEDGAVLMIVAVSLLFIIGMLALVFDLGRSVAARRDMENGTSAAALAAAQQCALGQGLANAQVAADDLLDQNTLNLGTPAHEPIIAPECVAQSSGLSSAAEKTVTVSSNIDLDYFFAEIFGLTSGTVTSSAVAQWGPITMTNPIPITVNVSALFDCQIPFEPPPPGQTKICNITYPQDQFSEPAWGILNLDQWNQITPSTACHVSNDTIVDIIDAGGWPGPALHLNEPPYDPTTHQGQVTYDCMDNGLQFSSWAELQGRVLTFPVVDIPTSVTDVSGPTLFQEDPNCSSTDPSAVNHCKVSNADVIGFVQFRVSGVDQHHACDLQSAGVCLTVEWSPTIGQGVPGQATLGFGDNGVRLVK